MQNISKKDINKYINNNKIKIHVITNSKKEGLFLNDNSLVLRINAKPINNEANKYIINFFKKNYKLKVEIISGLKSNDKILSII